MLLLREVVKTNKPIIISCGMTNFDEITKLTSLDKNNTNYILLHTVSSYLKKYT